MLLHPGARLFLLLPILGSFCHQSAFLGASNFLQVKRQHKPTALNQAQLRTLSKLTDVRHMNEVLDNICVERVVGTQSHREVRNYIKSSLEESNWHVETDEFEDYTPVFGTLKFENIIAKWNPDATRFLTLACHYDSKYEKNFKFVGATDSAVPCMQMLNLAKVMQKQLNTIKNNDLSLMLLFLDGEEAFKHWGPTDSIYGARHLAKKWDSQKYTYSGYDGQVSDLDRIDLFVLLDLIGGKNPKFYNYFGDTTKWFSLMAKAETALSAMREFKSYPYQKPQDKYFQEIDFNYGVEDDHIPFLRKNVPILHLIPYPFPKFWHKAGDNRDAVHMATVENLNKILRVFVASYLNMQVNATYYVRT